MLVPVLNGFNQAPCLPIHLKLPCQEKKHLSPTTRRQLTTKEMLLQLLLLCLSSRHLTVLAESTNVKTFELPPFSMQLMIGQQDVSPDPFEWPLIVATSSHLSRFIDMELGSVLNESTLDWGNIVIQISLNASLDVDVESALAFPTGTVIKANFIGEAQFDNSNQAAQDLTQSSVITMVTNAFQGTNFWELLLRFREDDILRDIGDVQIWVSDPLSDGSETEQTSDESPPPGSTPDSTSRLSSLKIILLTIVFFLVAIGVTAACAFVNYRQKHGAGAEGHDEEETSKGSASTIECDIFSEENPRSPSAAECDILSDDNPCTNEDSQSQKADTVFSTEYWKDAWAKAAAQITPRPPRSSKPRNASRQPSAVKPNLSSIREEEGEEEWEESSSGGIPIQSLSLWMVGPSLGVTQRHHSDSSSSLPDRDGDVEMTMAETICLDSRSNYDMPLEETSPRTPCHIPEKFVI